MRGGAPGGPRGRSHTPGIKAAARRRWLRSSRERGSGDSGRQTEWRLRRKDRAGASGPQLACYPGGGEVGSHKFEGGRDSEASFIYLHEIHLLSLKGVSAPLLGAFKLDDSRIG